MMSVVGYAGSALLAFCGLPLAIESFRNKRANISAAFIWTWFFGEVLTLIYVVYLKDLALTLNYFCNILFIGIVIYYKYFPKK